MQIIIKRLKSLTYTFYITYRFFASKYKNAKPNN